MTLISLIREQGVQIKGCLTIYATLYFENADIHLFVWAQGSTAALKTPIQKANN